MAKSSLTSWFTPSTGLLVGSVLVLIGFLGHNWIFYGVGSMIQLVSFVLLLTRDKREGPLSLSEQVKSRIGPLGMPGYRVTLIDPGQRRAETVKCLIELYMCGLPKAWSLVQNTPSVLGTAVSKEEADFVETRLTECGAKVDVVRVVEEDHIE